MLLQETPGGGQTASAVSLTKCAGNDRYTTKIAFGEQNKQSICWKLESSSSGGTLPGSQSDVALTALFQKMWENEVTNWETSTPSTYWKSNCTSGHSPKWVVVTSGNSQILGYCDNNAQKSSSSEVSFLDIDKDSSKSKVQKVSFCEKDCFSSPGNSGIETLETKQDNNWSEIGFYSNSQ
ncbi:hypothetical protein [Candidatus Mycoplasma haematominutum]|uniref:Uncharacterized protein n=1 Tax=Candidatus Mycoplasma haematominutum 'Birmingham 1' TaxID=1116213 RepID=G8C3Q3_9MOLU|nr:hypothetical protein [Candidatus Mycoplasma haematominutum]CCE66951.1 hypothetical protein MHM_04330 [Candidatus Mycoplasma haematominutum 'Birmingham 1']